MRDRVRQLVQGLFFLDPNARQLPIMHANSAFSQAAWLQIGEFATHVCACETCVFKAS
jgi:hypothetical protein